MIQRPIQKPVKKTSNAKKVVFILLALILLAGLGGAAHHFTTDAVKTTPSGVKLSPPTTQEKASGDGQKDVIVQNKDGTTSTPQPTTSSGKKAVSIVITDASSTSVTAYATGVLEDGGTCTATFTQGTTVVTGTSSGFSNVSYTQCAPITPNLPTGGSWSVVVSYSSTSAEGTSAAQTF